ncbi:MAG: DNA (cytosine-5-)-methyltransferase [Peptococcaceae bacterium]|nr:DNA (cytosine-5-)-methyltransferase [Peptococcaceae bacterium]
MKLLSLFSGIGAFEKALDRCKIEYELVNYCEIDKYASKAYALIHGVEETMNLGDITKVDTSVFDGVDLVTYGFPCQDISNAGKQKGFEDENGERTRSGLFFEALRIIEDTQPKFAICENVKALVGKKFEKEFATVLDSLDAAGYNNYWQVLNAKDYGIPQNRERVFVISIRKDIDHGFIFPEPFPLELRLKDVLEDEVDEKYYLSDEQTARLTRATFHQEKARLQEKDCCDTLLARDYKDPKLVQVENDGDLLYDKSMIGFEGKARGYNDVAPTISAREYKEPRLVNETKLKNIREDAEIIQVGQMYPNSGNPQAGRIYEPDGISPSLDTCQGGNRMPKVALGIDKSYNDTGVIDVANCITAREDRGVSNRKKEGTAVLEITEPICAASRGRNPENPSDRTTGAPTVQRLEFNENGTTNALTTVQKDNYIVEPAGEPKIVDDTYKGREPRVYEEYSPAIRASQTGFKVVEPFIPVKNATKKGYLEAVEGDSVNLQQPNSKTRRGRVGKQISQTLQCTDDMGVVVAEPNALEKILADGPLEEPVTTRGKDIASTIRSSIHKQGSRNLVENIKSGRGYEGIIEPAKKRRVRGFVKGTKL